MSKFAYTSCTSSFSSSWSIRRRIFFAAASSATSTVVFGTSVSGEGELQHVSADLDVVDAANGLLGLLRQLGRAAPTIQGAEADRLRDAVQSSSFDVWTREQDHLLRRLQLSADLGLDVPASLQRVLGKVVGAKVEFELAVDHPNEPVTVMPPKNPRPSSELPGG